jgi:hypothetical protein
VTEIRMASGMTGHRDQAVIRTKQRSTALHARMSDVTTGVLPASPHVQRVMAAGPVNLAGPGGLGEGDSARDTPAEDGLVTA